MLLAAPSPAMVTSRDSANAGQRKVNASARRGVVLVLISGKVSGERPSACTKSQSQSHVRWWNRPVADAIEILVAVSPNNRRHRYSANPSQQCVALNF